MPFALGDRAVQTSTTTGTGTMSLDTPATGLRSFVTAVGNGNTTAYLIVDASGNWEIGIGTVTSGSPDTLSRNNPPIKSSNSNNLVNFGAGSKTIACVMAADLTPYLGAVPSYADNQILQRASSAWAPRTPQQVLKTLMEAVTFAGIAAAATTDIGASSDFTVDITGTGVSISSFGTTPYCFRVVRFVSAGNTIVHGASLALRTGANRAPAAGDIGVFVSDASALWDEVAWFPADPNEANKHVVSHTFHYPGLVEAISGTANKMLRHYISVPSGYAARVTGCKYNIDDGSSVPFEVRKNGAGMTGFTGLSATTTPATTAPTPVAAADGDYIEVVQSTPSGNPHNFVCTVFVEYSRNW